jgi:hypothetical protein
VIGGPEVTMSGFASDRAEVPVAQIADRGHPGGEMVVQCLGHDRLDLLGAVAGNAIECHRPAVGDQTRVGVDQARQQRPGVAEDRASRRRLELERLNAGDLPAGYEHRCAGSAELLTHR